MSLADELKKLNKSGYDLKNIVDLIDGTAIGTTVINGYKYALNLFPTGNNQYGYSIKDDNDGTLFEKKSGFRIGGTSSSKSGGLAEAISRFLNILYKRPAKKLTEEENYFNY